ncbi:hypothetical protein [Phytohabitans aurantiacus]|uniref:Uncharacterized protein n=1 Tax=Phytohabitans aurantiacus TaxID=3016789 RepID=A0ABQ5RB26_9ACTN|nr:hypothetical protein [Phytohabitans aurantiacus]GLI03939.1 hypothetical protein Pa4123_92200 [Phytohabitans aurantiacus]
MIAAVTTAGQRRRRGMLSTEDTMRIWNSRSGRVGSPSGDRAAGIRTMAPSGTPGGIRIMIVPVP